MADKKPAALTLTWDGQTDTLTIRLGRRLIGQYCHDECGHTGVAAAESVAAEMAAAVGIEIRHKRKGEQCPQIITAWLLTGVTHGRRPSKGSSRASPSDPSS
ncbi:hypothetical protein [Teichococcus rhizosphaerae]|uniref:hypothetical protein n=1 Tax=Teichococcus rhizosphaerae TaxID=1335062 RepID=UPI001145F844|nr:hypothetical protein [Pseudoroseomonas rhizosphaerae]